MADFTLKDLQDAFTGSLKSVFGGNSAPKPASTTPAASDAGSRTTGSDGGTLETFKKIAQEGVPVATAFYTIGKDGKEASAVFTYLAQMSPVMSKGLSGFVSAIEDGRQQINAAGKVGLGNSNFPQLQEQAKLAGMSIEKYTALVKDTGAPLTGLGANVNQASERFSGLSKEVLASNVGKKLLEAGVSAEDITKATAIMAANTKVNLEKDAAGKAQLISASAELARQIDETARITGKSQDEIRGEMAQRSKSAETILSMNLMNEKQREAFQKTQAALSGFGPTIQNLGQTIASGARLKPEDMAALNALGPAAGSFQRAIRMQQAATTDAQKAQADAALKDAQAKINAFQSSERYARLALQGSGEVSEMQKKMITENQRRAGAQTAVREGGLDQRQALQSQERTTQLEQQGKIGRGPQAGQVDTGQAATRAVNNAQEEFRKNAAGGAIAINNFNTAIGKSPGVIDSFNKAVELGAGKIGETPEQKAKRIQGGVDKVMGAAGVKEASPVDANKFGAPGTSLKDRRDGGSKDATGSWFENFGSGKLMELHKQEAVVPKDKLPEFMQDMMKEMSGSQEKMQGIMGSIKKPVDKEGATNEAQLKALISQFKPPRSKEEGMAQFEAEQSAKKGGINLSDIEKLMPKGMPPQLGEVKKPAIADLMPKMPEIKQPAGMFDQINNMFGKMKTPDNLKDPASLFGKIKQPEFPKLPMMPDVASEANRRKDTAETTKKTAEAAKAPAAPAPAPAAPKGPTAPVLETGNATLNDVLLALNQLNKTMGQVAAHSENISDASNKTARLAGKASGNRALA